MTDLALAYDILREESDQMSESVGIKRRVDGPNRNRLNNVVSIYIPPSSFSIVGEQNEHTNLLSNFQQHTLCKPETFGELYGFDQIYDGAELFKVAHQRIGIPQSGSTDEIKKISTIAADAFTIYVSFEDLPYIFLLRGPGNEIGGEESHIDNSIKGYIQLHVPRIGNIIPQELCVHSPNPEAAILYVVGYIEDKFTTDSVDRQWLLAKFSLTGQHIARTSIYPYERYCGIAVDKTDGNLLLACPRFDSPKYNPTSHVPGQVCKLTPGFERRVFSVTMGNDLATYRPNYITQESAGRCCWASVERTVNEETLDGGYASKSSRRLLAFPGRQPTGTDKQSPREWLHVCSWNFADLNPCRVAAFDANRLLVTDEKVGTLSYITWDEGQDRPSLHRITRPGSQRIQHLCSSYQTGADDDSVEPIAYIVSDSNIYSFAFNPSE